MAQAVVMFLDASARAAVEGLRERLAGHGLLGAAAGLLSGHRPHVSLAVAPTVVLDDPSLLSRIARQRLDIRMESVGAFAGSQGVLFLGVTVTRPLLDAHAAVHASIRGDGGGPSGHFRPGIWVPHCTLASGLDGHALGSAIAVLHPVPELTAYASAVEIVDTATGDTVLPSS